MPTLFCLYLYRNKLINSMKLFITGFLQVFFVCVNTYFIGKEMYAAVFVVGCIISLVWTYNVKKISIGSFTDRMVYALGAGVGAVSGLFASTNLFQYFQ